MKDIFIRIILIYNKCIFTWHEDTYPQCQRHYLAVITFYNKGMCIVTSLVSCEVSNYCTVCPIEVINFVNRSDWNYNNINYRMQNIWEGQFAPKELFGFRPNHPPPTSHKISFFFFL